MSTITAAKSAPPATLNGKRSSVDHTEVDQLKRYSGAYIPVVGGILQAKYGVKELRDANQVNHVANGRMDITLGVSHSIGNAAGIPVYASAFLHMAHPVILMLGHIAGVCGVVSTALDGGRDIYNGITEHSVKEVAIGAVKIGAGGIAAVGAWTANPIIMAAATGVYGLAVAYQNWAAVKKLGHDLVGDAPRHHSPLASAS